MATINDVAKKAGVATSTVTKVLKNYPNVSEKTKEKVLKAVDELGYVPNAIAAALSSKSSKKVALWININNELQAIDEVNMQYMFGAFNEAKELEVEVVTLFSPMYEDYDSNKIINILLSQGIKGLIIYGLNKNNIELNNVINSKKFYTVVVDAPNVNEKTSSISIDHCLAQYEVAKKTLEHHNVKKILYIAGGYEGYVTDMRISGIEKLQKEQNLNIDIEYGNFDEKTAYNIAIKEAENYDAIICASDLMCVGVKQALKKLSLNLPVCGFDGITLMHYVGENINSVRQDFYKISQQAIIECCKLIDGSKGRSIVVDYELVNYTYDEIIK